MKITEFIQEPLVLPHLTADSKAAVIEELASHLAAHSSGLAREAVVNVLMEREKLASTAIGEGVAIPHGKLEGAGQLWACVGRSEHGVDFESMDGRPTHIFFVLIAPENSTGVHLKALARISRLFKSGEFRGRLMAAPDAHEMYRVIADEDAKY